MQSKQATLDWKDQLELLHHESYMWCLSCCNYDKELAKDVLQSVYLKIYENSASFKARSSLKTWLFSIIKFTSVDFVRKYGMHMAKLNEAHNQIPVPESIEDAARANLFRSIMQSLSNQQREVLTLAFYHDLTLKEIAPLMELSIGTVRTHYERGKENFKKLVIQFKLDAELL
jgi:RNA polymerase sigma-70 factor (ECF subfamily)